MTDAGDPVYFVFTDVSVLFTTDHSCYKTPVKNNKINDKRVRRFTHYIVDDKLVIFLRACAQIGSEVTRRRHRVSEQGCGSRS